MPVPEEMRNPTTYADATRLEAVGSHEYRAIIHPDYSYGATAHGGFMQALLLEALRLHFRTTLASFNQPDTLSLHTEFLRPGATGEASITIKDTRLSKTSSTVHVALSQKGKECVVGYATHIDHAKARGISIPAYHKPEPALPPIDFDLVDKHNDSNWQSYTIPYRKDAPNAALSNVTFVVLRRPSADRSIVQHWLSCSRPDEAWTTPKLALALDQFVPPAENFFDSPHNVYSAVQIATKWGRDGPPMPPNPPHGWEVPRWYATGNMTLEVKRPLPAEGVKWLFCRYRSEAIEHGRFDVHCEVWNERMGLIAVSQQLWYLIDLSKSPQWQAILKARGNQTANANKL